MRHDLTFARQSSGSLFLRTAMLALTPGSCLACCSMSLRAPLHGLHIQRGCKSVPVFVMPAIGRAGPQPRTQATQYNSPGSAIRLSTATVADGMATGPGLTWTGVATPARDDKGWPSEALEEREIPLCWLAMLVSWIAKWITNWRIDLLLGLIWQHNGWLL